MPLFFFKNRKQKRKKEIDKLAKEIVKGAAKKKQMFEPGKNPTLLDFQRKINDIKNS